MASGARRLSRTARDCFKLLQWYAARFKLVYPTQATIGRHIGVKERRVRYALKELEKAGLLRVWKSGPKPATYELLMPVFMPVFMPVKSSASINSLNSVTTHPVPEDSSRMVEQAVENGRPKPGKNLSPREKVKGEELRDEILAKLSGACKFPTQKKPAISEQLKQLHFEMQRQA